MKKLLLEAQKNTQPTGAQDIQLLLERVTRITAIPDIQRYRILRSFTEAAGLIVGQTQNAASRLGVRFGHDSFGWWLEIIDNGGANNQFVSETKNK